MILIIVNMYYKYDEILKEFNILFKDEFKKMFKEKIIIEVKKIFIFFILFILLLFIVFLFLIFLIFFNKLDFWVVKNAVEVLKVVFVFDIVKNISWVFFVLIIIFMFVGLYIFFLYFLNKFKIK